MSHKQAANTFDNVIKKKLRLIDELIGGLVSVSVGCLVDQLERW